jgi:hypothetical protein
MKGICMTLHATGRLWLITTMVLTLSYGNSTQSWPTYKQLALISGVIIAGKIAYDYMYHYDATKDFEHLIDFSSQIDLRTQEMHARYANELSCVGEKKYEELYNKAKNSSNACQFSSYVCTIKQDIQELVSLEHKVSETIIRVFEQRICAVKKTDTASGEQVSIIKRHIEEYDFVLEILNENLMHVNKVRHMLQQAYNYLARRIPTQNDLEHISANVSPENLEATPLAHSICSKAA